MGSKLYNSERYLQSQLYGPVSNPTIQTDTKPALDLHRTTYDFDSDDDEVNKDNPTTAVSEHHTKLKEMERDISNQSKEAALMKQNIKKLEANADSYEIHPDNWSKDRDVRMRIKGKQSKIMELQVIITIIINGVY